MKFAELELHPSLLGAIEKLKFEDTTPVQAATMPHILEGRDVAGLAQTGTGKTAAFLLPLMERILRAGPPPPEQTPEQAELAAKRAFPDWRPNQFILVLVPTRELAEQVYENCLKLRGESALRAVSIYGGVSYDKQKQGLRDGVEFVIATPGRLIDLYKEHLVDLKQVRAIVFDEADRMFDMGFKDDMKYILSRVPKERQFLVFSATLNMDVMSTAYQFGANPVDVDVSRDQPKAENVDDKIFHVGGDEKPMYLLTLLKKHSPRQSIIFSNFKMNVPRITQFLNDNKVPAVGISSLLTQAQRMRVMEQFKGDNDRNVLVATDVAARGLDIKGVDMVINYELPEDAENYVHRIGRTGRAGEKGKAFSLVSDRDVESLQRIEDYLRHKVDADWLDEGDFVTDYRGMPSDRGERRGPRGEGRGGGGPRGEARGEGGRGGGGGRGRDRGGRGDGRRPGRGGESHAEARGEQAQSGTASGEQAGEMRPEPRAAGHGGEPRRRGGRDRDRGDRQRQQAQSGEGAGKDSAQAPRPERGGGPGRHSQHARGGEGRQGQQGGRGEHRRGGGRGDGRHPQAHGEGRGGGNGQHGRGPQHPRGDRPHGGHAHGRGKAAGPAAKAPPAKNLGQKVTSFFKKLFGQ